MACGAEQEVAERCRHCHVGMAHYFCGTCKLFDDDPTHDIYHCPFCNLCRRGKGLGVDMFHCMRCNQCMALSLAQSHVCRERGLESDCPICHEDLFTSAAPIRQTQCGHFMHSACYKLYTADKYTCPMCSKSLADMVRLSRSSSPCKTTWGMTVQHHPSLSAFLGLSAWTCA
jgi:zinc finger-like protein